jgi:hypothetical protein
VAGLEIFLFPKRGEAIVFSPGEFKGQVLLLNSGAFYNSKGQAFTP